MVGGSGSPRTDAQFDFVRARRRQALEQLSARLRRLPDDVNTMLPFEDVVAAYGYVSERDLGLQVIDLDTIVGSVGRGQDFDRSFRPLTARVRPRWERIAAAHRRGEAMPPIDVYRIGTLHFVRDGHHRVSVARQLGLDKIEAHVIEVITRLDAGDSVRLAQLPLLSHKRLFQERVPLPDEDRVAIKLTDEWRYAALAEGVEAWGFRAMQERQTWMSRGEVARAWFDEEYRPVVALLREADLIGSGTETEAYIRIVTLRYLLLQTHGWDDEVVERLRQELAKPRAAVDDTLVHRLRREVRSGS